MLSNKGCALRTVIQLVGNAHPSSQWCLQQAHPRRTGDYCIRIADLQPYRAIRFAFLPYGFRLRAGKFERSAIRAGKLSLEVRRDWV